MAIVDLNVMKVPPIEISLDYSGRIKVVKMYTYDENRKDWIEEE
ncbi:MAG: hypothetical protein QXZ17_07075 [Nitrososphaerota archaeon]